MSNTLAAPISNLCTKLTDLGLLRKQAKASQISHTLANVSGVKSFGKSSPILDASSRKKR